jgi:hypothetical protein
MADRRCHFFRPAVTERNGPNYAWRLMSGRLSEAIAIGSRKLGLIFARYGESHTRVWRPEAAGASGRGAFAVAVKSLGLGLAVVLLGTNLSSGGVLNESEVKKVQNLKPLFQNLMVDLVQTSKRTDISGGDADCVKSTVRELLEISQELSSYEYLITIEGEMPDFNSDSMRDVVKFAIDKSSTILSEERKRLAQLSDQCTRFPLSFGKTQQALQFIDTTNGLLKSIQARL